MRADIPRLITGAFVKGKNVWVADKEAGKKYGGELKDISSSSHAMSLNLIMCLWACS
jgi:hypothetical protein